MMNRVQVLPWVMALVLAACLALSAFFAGCHSIPPNGAEEKAVRAHASPRAIHNLMNQLVKCQSPRERQPIIAAVARELGDAPREAKHGALREFAEAAAFRNTLDLWDTGGDIRARAGLGPLVEALDMDAGDVLIALQPLRDARAHKGLRFMSWMLIREAGAYNVTQGPEGRPIFPIVAQAVAENRLCAPAEPLMWQLVRDMYALDPEAAALTWLAVDPSSYRADPGCRHELESKVLTVGRLRRQVSRASGAPSPEEAVTATREIAALLADLADERVWPVQWYVYAMLTNSNRFHEPHVAETLRANAVPEMAFLRRVNLGTDSGT